MHADCPAEAGHHTGDVASGFSRTSNRTSFGARFVLALLRGYKLAISPHFYGSCRFIPSCADYATEAVMRHGALAGGWLALKRLARCHPLCSGGLDPVGPSAN